MALLTANLANALLLPIACLKGRKKYLMLAKRFQIKRGRKRTEFWYNKRGASHDLQH